MSNHVIGWFTKATPGSISKTGLGFKPKKVTFTLAQKTSTTENFAHLSYGVACEQEVDEEPVIVQFCHSIESAVDSNVGATKTFTDRCINHLYPSGGGAVNNVMASVTSMDADGFTINYTGADGGFVTYFEAED